MPFTISKARCSGANVIKVTFTEQPRFASPLKDGDASNLTYWTLIRDDTSEPMSLLTARSVTGDVMSLEFITFGTFPSDLFTYRISAFGLKSTIGTTLTNPMFALFAGMPYAKTDVAFSNALSDIQNPQYELDKANGAVRQLASGDYALESGIPLLKKLITRRVLVAQNEFFHLSDVDYGFGLKPKGFYTTTDLIVLKTLMERQIIQEPEIDSVKCNLELLSDNRLNVFINAKLKRSNQQISFSVPLDSTSGFVF